jgi:hypothetical protein
VRNPLGWPGAAKRVAKERKRRVAKDGGLKLERTAHKSSEGCSTGAPFDGEIRFDGVVANSKDLNG